jgi:hypothetical protein
LVDYFSSSTAFATMRVKNLLSSRSCASM